jgi:YD repeat-containing protein
LNGERLICVAGVYGQDNSEYRTEVDSFSRIKLSGNANLGIGSSWTVQTKAGLSLQFGATSDAKVMAVNTKAPLAWAVNRVSDTLQNYYSVIYIKDASADNEIVNHRVAEIKYTGNSATGQLPYCSVKFAYADRADVSFAYTYGTKSVSTRRLSGIFVWTDSFVNHYYQLSYRYSQQTNRSLLYKVQKIAGQSVIPPTIIDWDAWTDADPALTASQMWMRKDSYGGTNLPQFYEYGGNENNENGIISYLSLEDNNSTIHLTGNAWRAKAINYNVTASTQLTFEYKVPTGYDSEVVAIGVDTNYDADSSHVFQLQGTQSSQNQTYKAGSIYNTGSAGQWVSVTIPVGTHFTGNALHLVLINDDDNDQNGVGEVYFRNIRLYQQGQTGGFLSFENGLWECPELTSSSWSDYGFNFLDINSDGLVDIVRNAITGGADLNITSGLRQTLLNTGNGWSAEDTTWQLPVNAYLSSNDGDDTDAAFSFVRGSSNFTDFNGDGNPDLMVRNFLDGTQAGAWTTTVRPVVFFTSSVNNGNGWQENNEYSFPFATLKQSGYGASTNNRFRDWIETDLNGDGYVDLIANTYRGMLESNISANSQFNRGANDFLSLLYSPVLQNGNHWIVSQNYRTPDVVTPSLPGYLSEGIGKDDLGRGLVDLTGDGLPDLYAASPDCTKTFLNTGSGWDWVGPNSTSLICKENLAARLPFPKVSSGGSSRGCRLVDLNGDGLVDFLRGFSTSTGVHAVPGSQLSCHINNGNYDQTVSGSMFSPITSVVGQNWITPYTLDWDGSGVDNFGNEFADINGDGLTDLIFASTYINKSYTNTGNNFEEKFAYAFPPNVRFCSTAVQLDNKRRNARLLDINGDGFPDILGNLQGSAPEVWINQSKTEKIKTITDGFGSDIQITYNRLNDGTPQPGFGSRVYQKNFGTLPAGQVAIIDSRYVVSRYSAPDGLGARRYTSHRYGDLRFDRNTESSLGFAWAEVKDELTQQVTHTDYSQTFPYAGSPIFTKTTVLITAADITAANNISSGLLAGVSPGEICLSEESATYGQMPSNSGVGGVIYRPVQTTAVKTQRDLNCQIKSQTTTTQNVADFDEYGFLKQSTVTSLDGTTVTTTSNYNHIVTPTNWLLGRLSSSTIIKTKGSDSTTKTSSFTYHSTNGLLLSETIEPGNALSVTKTNTYDAFGNITANSVIGSGQTRTSSSTYDNRGRFVINEATVVDQLVLNVSYSYDAQRALLLSTTDINGLITRFAYDSFGTLKRTDFPDGTQSGESTGTATNTVVPADLASIPANIADELALPTADRLDRSTICYFRAKQSSGGPVSYVYLDAAGREILTSTTTLVDHKETGSARYKQIYGRTFYDARGRKIATSQPYAPGAELLYTTIQYDALDRALKTTRPNGSVEKVDCYSQVMLAGQPVTYSCVTANGAQTLHRWEDQHGRLIQSRDESGLTTEFIHDIEGHLTSVKVGGTLLLTNTFDTLGNKTAVWEANSGTSSTTYNAFGEAISSTNARGQITSFTYDVLGRPKTITRPGNEGTYTNFYDTAGGTAAKGKPSAITGPDGYAEAIIYDNLGRPAATAKTQFGETFATATTYDALGRTRTTTDAGGLTTATFYDPLYSIPVQITIGASPPGSAPHPGIGTVLWKAGTYDISGRATSQTLANGVTLNQTFNNATGNLEDLTSKFEDLTSPGNNKTYQSKSYLWDINGNLTQRVSTQYTFGSNPINPIVTENFTYDNINRLSSRTIGSNATENYSYSTTGNLLAKPGTSLQYNGPKPHQVTNATIKGVERLYQYDAAGYVINDGKRSFTWTSFGQLATLSYQSAPPLHEQMSSSRHPPTSKNSSTSMPQAAAPAKSKPAPPSSPVPARTK